MAASLKATVQFLHLSTMVSRKKAAGKARKAAKAKAKEEKNNQTTSINDRLELQMSNELKQEQETAQLLERMWQMQCKHGTKPLSSRDICLQFAAVFIESFREAVHDSCGERSVWQCLTDVQNAMATVDKFAEVGNDSAKMEIATSIILCMGTEYTLEGEDRTARKCATIARYFKQHIAVDLKQSQALPNEPKVGEMYECDEHTLVKFFRHRIPCSCLDEKYEEVKHVPKLGFCYNPQCSIPGSMPERSKTKYCSRCRNAVYCSRECQEADWSEHNPVCDMYAAMIATFEAKHQQQQLLEDASNCLSVCTE
jgi:hypothetical protein